MRGLLLAIALLLALRLPFLNHPIQGDDVYYLEGAQHAQIDPLHPLHARYVYQGSEVSMRGHPHPPLNAWYLAALLALVGDVKEAPFHAAYLLFSLIAVVAMWSLARRFSPQPVWATVLLITVPTFLVNGNSLESDLPFLAFWLAGMALWIRAVDAGRLTALIPAVGAFALSALAAYQSVALIPIAGLYLWQRRRQWRPAWVVLLTPAATLAAWQLFELATSQQLPAAVLSGYFQTYHLQRLANKASNAAALTVHLAWILFPGLLLRRGPVWALGLSGAAALAGALLLDPHPLFWLSFGIGILTLSVLLSCLRSADPDEQFLTAWILFFFSLALVVFFAGSARYILPLAAPLILLTTRRFPTRPKLLAAGFLVQLFLGLGLATANLDHWQGYKEFVDSLPRETFENRRVWVNTEFGLRFYAGAQGGLQILRGQAVRPGDVILSSKLLWPIPVTTGGGTPAPLAERTLTSAIPLRLIGLESRSAYSHAMHGLRPFDISTKPFDIVRAEQILERKPSLSFLPMNAPDAETQIVSGIYPLEDNTWRWAGPRAVVLLKSPSQPAILEATFRILDNSPGRHLRLLLDGVPSAEERYKSGGLYTLRSAAPVRATEGTATGVLTIDRAFQVPGDNRELGFILVSIGFR
ncbi:MAG: glycosyltransferase family 39 protein [Acidimicrobiia bacterium]|nr:glycosyltransferase family 39 protein [Acidimicrobiia bacterium]